MLVGGGVDKVRVEGELLGDGRDGGAFKRDGQVVRMMGVWRTDVPGG